MGPKLKTIRFEVLRLRSGGEEYEQENSPDAYDLRDDPEYIFEEPVRLRVALRLVGTTVLMGGEVSTVAQAPCARCLEPLRVPLSAPVDLIYMTDDKLREPERYPELADDNTAWYDGEIVYPAEKLRELLLLELPAIPACELEDDDFCPVRGVHVGPLVFGPAEEFEREKEAAEGEESLGAKLRRLREEME